MTGNRRGLVLGGKLFYIGDPGLYLYDRQTLKLAAQKAFKGLDLLALAFSADGSRYAVVTGGRIFIDDRLRRYDPETTSLVRVQDTLTGATRAAFPAPTRWCPILKFSPDGKRLAVVGDDGSLEVWDLPG